LPIKFGKPIVVFVVVHMTPTTPPTLDVFYIAKKTRMHSTDGKYILYLKRDCVTSLELAKSVITEWAWVNTSGASYLQNYYPSL
jgi:hypothetical protein